MLTREQNELLTGTGPGTPGGALLRCYWQPVALAEDLPPGGAPLPVRLLGEDLVLFRDPGGRVGLLGLHCPHRGTDLTYGRIEDGGLRCIYHGWLFDVGGRCLEQPGEPAGSDYRERVRHAGYPCIEYGDLILAYLGGGEPPLPPPWEPFRVAPEHRLVNQVFQDCNYLQGNEGNIDPAHLSFLHRPLVVGDRRAVPGTRDSADRLYGADLSPLIHVEPAAFGMRVFALRRAGPGTQYLRITNFLMPNSSAIVGNEGRVGEGYSIHWHVPIDDEHHWRYEVTFNRVRPLDHDAFRAQVRSEVGPDRRLKRNAANRYGQDRDAMSNVNFSGMGSYFPAQDAFAIQSQGAVQDRSAEHLSYTDKAVAAARHQILAGIRAVASGSDPVGVGRQTGDLDPDDLVVLSHAIPEGTDWKVAWRQLAGHAS